MRELDGRDITGHQVADAQAEDPRPLFLGDRRAMPLANGLAIITARLPALLEHPLDHAPGHLHAEVGHRGAVGKREDVRRLERLVRGIHERLADRHLR